MGPILLAILDGVGIREEVHGNALKQAYTPIFNHLINTYPHSLLDASGKEVGLPDFQMGNSEVGHLNIGAGRIVHQPLELINQKIKDRTLFDNKYIVEVINHVKEHDSKLHVLGMLSDGGVHSHLSHFLAILDLAKYHQIKELYFHLFTDGRDTLPKVAYSYFRELEEKIKDVGIGKIATISGRYYAMDRDKRWDRTKKAYQVMVHGIGPKYESAKEVIKDSYLKQIEDEFIVPSLLDEEGLIDHNDGLIFANFRPDRATQILTAITNPTFKNFETKKLTNIKLVSLMPCIESVIGKYAYRLETLNNTLGAYLANLGFNQLRIAETEKYVHVTYFFDGGREKILDGCKTILINSPKVATYDLKPEMSAYEITDILLKELDNHNYNLIVLNYANGDMVGHTGNLEATIKAIETVDENLGRLYNKLKAKGGLSIVTADHGNCEYMLDANNEKITSHTTNKVPFIISDQSYQLKNGKLGDIAPTILKLMKVEIPKEMTGNVLIEPKKVDI